MPTLFEGVRFEVYEWSTYPYPPTVYVRPEAALPRRKAAELLERYAAAIGRKIRVERDLSRRTIGQLTSN